MKHLKQEFDKLTFKETLVYSLAILSIAAGFTLLFLNMYLPPRGEIHESVLTAFGIILIFVGSLLGLEMKYACELNKFKKNVIDIIASTPQGNDKESIANSNK